MSSAPEAVLEPPEAEYQAEVSPSKQVIQYKCGISAHVRSITTDKLGNLVAEVDFINDRRDDFTELLGIRINLHSVASRKKAADELSKSKIYNAYGDEGGIPWNALFENLANMLLKAHREGDKPKEIYPSEDVSLTPDYLVEPILYLNHPTVLFGDYGSAKSLFALVVATTCVLPWYDNFLELIAPREPSPCLYLDYEDEEDSFKRRWSALQTGLGVGLTPILYKRMTNTLSDSVEQLSGEIANEGIRLLIIDSLGPAARGNLNDPEPAIKYHAALRQLGITSLTLAHTSKDQLTKKRTIFGSVFFTNLARSVWEIKAEQETGENETTISLKQTKANLSKLHNTLGYQFTFSDKSIKVAKADLKDTGLSGELPLSFQIRNLLRSGAKTVKAIAEALDANEASIRTITNRLYHKKQLAKIGDSFGLPTGA